MPDDELYDRIATSYHLVYADWDRSIGRQADALEAILAERLGPGSKAIRDVSCGIGTQALGLAACGHRVVASDLSPASVDRARSEARRRNLSIEFAVADMRRCDEDPRQYDVVLSADNSVPHLQSDVEIATAFRAMFRSTRAGGIAVISVRDYAVEDRAPLQLRSHGVRQTPAGLVNVFQRWAFDRDGERYEVAMFFVFERDGAAPEVLVGRARYYAVKIDVLTELLRGAGFVDVERLDGRFFQPVLVGRRPD